MGAVLVKNNTLLTGGYNGPPLGMAPCVVDEQQACPRKAQGYGSGEGLHLCVAAHAERNALIQAARTGVTTMDSTLYCYCGQVCKDCAVEIVNAGVKRLVFLEGAPDYDSLAGYVLKECGVEVVRLNYCK